MTQQQFDGIIAQIQEILDRDYPGFEWRVLPSPPTSDTSPRTRWVYIHARTRDFRYRCRVGRPWTVIASASPLHKELTLERGVRCIDGATHQTMATLNKPRFEVQMAYRNARSATPSHV